MAIFCVKVVKIVLKYKTIIAILRERCLVFRRKVAGFSEKGGWFLRERCHLSPRN